MLAVGTTVSIKLGEGMFCVGVCPALVEVIEPEHPDNKTASTIKTKNREKTDLNRTLYIAFRLQTPLILIRSEFNFVTPPDIPGKCQVISSVVLY